MKFHDYIALALNKKFKWGEHDCITFAIGWGSIFTGKNLLAPFGTWYDRRTAMQAIKSVGGLAKAFDNSKDLLRVNPNFAKDGDLFICGKSACLLCGEYLVGAGISGLAFKDRLLGNEAWTYVKE